MDNTTWHDQRPSHKPIPKAVVVANEHAIIARKVYDDYIEEMLNNGIPGIDWTEVDYLSKRANDAEQQLEHARHEALNPDECTCLPDLPDGRVNAGRGTVCPACAAEPYDDTIPFGGE
jgi:hypothetical protein